MNYGRYPNNQEWGTVMEFDTSNLGAKLASGGMWTALGAILTALVQAWRDKKKDDTQNTAATLGAINKGSEVLMNSLLQTQKQLSAELRATRRDLAQTDRKLENCEVRHREAEARAVKAEERTIRAEERIAHLEQQLAVQPVANQDGEV